MCYSTSKGDRFAADEGSFFFVMSMYAHEKVFAPVGKPVQKVPEPQKQKCLSAYSAHVWPRSPQSVFVHHWDSMKTTAL